MTVDIAFEELAEYVRKHYGKKLGFARVAANEVCVTYEQRVFIATIQVPVNVTVDEVLPDSVAVTYSGKMGIDKIISGMLVFLMAKVPQLEALVKVEEGHHLRINLNGLEETRKVVDKVSLNDIEILENAVRVTAGLK